MPLDEEGGLAQGFSFGHQGLREGKMSSPDAVISLQNRWREARRIESEKVDGWWKTRWAIAALHCHCYWEETKEKFQEGCE